ncbi:MAG: Holliday junction branch migration protein RuvA [Actinobacteria bacterium]|nr:Holliday junction branch migration protein RuvA [Actinomycetota bacterium]
MIGSLRGRVLDRSSRGEIVVDVGGVGYRATVAPRTLAALGPAGTEITLHTHLHVREDALALFGFANASERDCFEALIGARGVGPSLALAILSVHTPAELHRVLAEGDLDALTLVPGVGRKTAARLLMELKARFDVPDLELAEMLAEGTTPAPARADLRAALAGLGYGPDEVGQVLRELPADGDVEDLLRAALKLLAAAR